MDIDEQRARRIAKWKRGRYNLDLVRPPKDLCFGGLVPRVYLEG